jgi:hypothetical protein
LESPKINLRLSSNLEYQEPSPELDLRLFEATVSDSVYLSLWFDDCSGLEIWPQTFCRVATLIFSAVSDLHRRPIARWLSRNYGRPPSRHMGAFFISNGSVIEDFNIKAAKFRGFDDTKKCPTKSGQKMLKCAHS